MEDGDVAGVDMAGLPLGIFLQRVVERAVDGSAFLGGEGQQPFLAVKASSRVPAVTVCGMTRAS